MDFVSYLINGLSLGSVYAIIALGYTMVYGIAKMLNFAHGDVIMIGAYVALTCMTHLQDFRLWPACWSAVVACTALGVLIERVGLQTSAECGIPAGCTDHGHRRQLPAAEPGAFDLWTERSVFPDGSKLVRSVSGRRKTEHLRRDHCHHHCLYRDHGGTDASSSSKSKAGQAMRAVSEDKGAAQLMGINVNGTIALTFAIGSALAAIAGVLLCSAYPSLSPYTGAMPGIKAFVAAVFGGIGSIPGAFIGGILLGVIEILARAYISSQMADAIVFAVLIIVLLVKPTGILGKNIQEKV